MTPRDSDLNRCVSVKSRAMLHRLLASLLPSTWPDRTGILDSVTRLDAKHGGDASALLLDAWTWWHRHGDVPQAGPLRDLIAVLAELLGGVGHELRRRRRPTGLNDETRGSLRTVQFRINNAEGKGDDR